MVASDRGSLSIALVIKGEFFISKYNYKNDSQLPLKVPGTFRVTQVWAGLALLSIFFTTRLHLVRFVLVLLLDEFDHNLKSVLRGPFLVRVFSLPLRLVSFPFLVDLRFPLFVVC